MFNLLKYLWLHREYLTQWKDRASWSTKPSDSDSMSFLLSGLWLLCVIIILRLITACSMLYICLLWKETYVWLFQATLLRFSLIRPLFSHVYIWTRAACQGRLSNHWRPVLVDRVRLPSFALPVLLGKLVYTFIKGEGSWNKWILGRYPTPNA